MGNQDKYDSITGYIAYKLFNNMDVYTEYKHYYNFDNNYVLKFGVSRYF